MGGGGGGRGLVWLRVGILLLLLLIGFVFGFGVLGWLFCLFLVGGGGGYCCCLFACLSVFCLFWGFSLVYFRSFCFVFLYYSILYLKTTALMTCVEN